MVWCRQSEEKVVYFLLLYRKEKRANEEDDSQAERLTGQAQAGNYTSALLETISTIVRIESAHTHASELN